MSKLALAGWRASAACVSADPDLFFPVSTVGLSVAQIDQARGVCASCLVMRQCLDYAMESKVSEGIWGGTTPDDRMRARKQQAARRRREAAGNAA